MEAYITSVSAGGIGEIIVTFDLRDEDKRCTSKFLISDGAYTELALSVGLSTKYVYDAVEREEKIYAVYKKALNLLCFSSSSKRSLQLKLVSKGYEPEISSLALERLEANGLLREADFALREGEKCLEKLWGERRIRAHLKEKGYSDEVVNGVFFSFEDMDVDFGDNCISLLEKKYSHLPKDKKELQKIIASLMRYGYSLSQIKQAIKKMNDEN
jgi:regulatory protein